MVKDGVSINRVSKLAGKSFQTVKKVKVKLNNKYIEEQNQQDIVDMDDVA